LKKDSGEPKRGGRLGGFGFAVACATVAIIAHGAIALAGLLLLPGIGARLVEQTPGRPMTRAMILFGLAASAPAATRLWMAGGGWDAGVDVALDPLAIARAWAAQATAWIVAESLPVLLIARADLTARAQLRTLRAARTVLEQEWTFPPPT
jgi:hypothetical protein